MFLAEPNRWDRVCWPGAVRILFKAYLLVDLSQGVSALIPALVSSVRLNRVSCCPGLLLGCYPEAQELWWHGWRYRKASRVWLAGPWGCASEQSGSVLHWWNLGFGRRGHAVLCRTENLCFLHALNTWSCSINNNAEVTWRVIFGFFFLWSLRRLNLAQLSCKCINMGPLKTPGGIGLAVLLEASVQSKEVIRQAVRLFQGWGRPTGSRGHLRSALTFERLQKTGCTD